MNARPAAHQPVLVEAVLDLLQVQRGLAYIDATAGLGGHTAALLERGARRVLAVDADPAAAAALARTFETDERVCVRHGNYRTLAALAGACGFNQASGVLLDLGLSSAQLADAQRGFSFRLDGPLDMRFDPESGAPAEQLVNRLSEIELVDLIHRLGEDRRSRRIARRVVARRPIRSTTALAAAVASAFPGRQRIHPATRTFQALRIAANDELGALADGLTAAQTVLRDGGRIAVIAYHSLEDRIVKRRFKAWARDGHGLDLTPKPIRPDASEVALNRRARSARLRALQVCKAG